MDPHLAVRAEFAGALELELARAGARRARHAGRRQRQDGAGLAAQDQIGREEEGLPDDVAAGSHEQGPAVAQALERGPHGPVVVAAEVGVALQAHGDDRARGLRRRGPGGEPREEERSTSERPALLAALGEMRALRALALDRLPNAAARRLVQARAELGGRTLGELVDVDRLARMHALLSVFEAVHPLVWHNMRFYHDPVRSRLEPILFDVMAGQAHAREPAPFRAQGLTEELAEDPAYYAAFFVHLGSMLRPGWLDGLFSAVGPELARAEAALRAGGGLPPGASAEDVRRWLVREIDHLRAVCNPAAPVGLEASSSVDTADRTWLEIGAWSTTRVPVLLEGFRPDTGRFVPAAEAAPGGTRSGVVLPADGCPRVFRVPLAADAGEEVEVRARFRLLTSVDAVEQGIGLHRGIPAPAPVERTRLEEALERHDFLRYDPVAGGVRSLPGSWEVAEDLVLPPGVTLVLPAGTTLRFSPVAALRCAGPLVCEGRAERPVVLGPAEGASSWPGIVVQDAGGRSRWEHVALEHAAGGAVFHRSPVNLQHCRFESCGMDAALRVFGTDVLAEDVAFRSSRSSSLAGEFASGELRSCSFEDGGGHGLVVTGGRFVVRDCRFSRLAGEAYLGTEGSVLEVDGARVPAKAGER